MDTTRDDRLALVAARQHAAFTVVQALDAGFSYDTVERRVDAGGWRWLAHDVLALAGAPRTWRQSMMAAVLEARCGAVSSHRSAGALLGVPGFDPGALEIMQLRGGHHRKSIARVHETPYLPADHVTVVDGIPCTTIARFLFDIAGTEHPKRVERAFDNALDRAGLTIASATHVVATMARRGRPGSTLMRALLAAREHEYVPPASDLEALFDAFCVAYGIPPFDREVWAGGETPVGRVDRVDRDARLLVEIQSKKHHGSWMAREADMDRRAELVAAGYRILEVTYFQLVHEPEKTARRLRSARRTGQTAPQPEPAVPVAKNS